VYGNSGMIARRHGNPGKGAANELDPLAAAAGEPEFCLHFMRIRQVVKKRFRYPDKPETSSEMKVGSAGELAGSIRHRDCGNGREELMNEKFNYYGCNPRSLLQNIFRNKTDTIAIG